MECVKVDTLVSGEIDCADFKDKLLANKDKPAIINVNIGNTRTVFHIRLNVKPFSFLFSHLLISDLLVL